MKVVLLAGGFGTRISEESMYKPKPMVELGGMFCMGQCHKGVSVKVDDQGFSVTPDTVEVFFKENVLSKLNA